VAAVGSYLEARRQRGVWLVRMEDIDPPREEPGAADRILYALEAYGLHWDGPVCYQSRREEAYRAALADLEAGGWIYPCNCSRKEIQAAGRRLGLAPGVYPGTCRLAPSGSKRDRALRVRTEGADIHFEDRLQGHQRQRLEQAVGDFILNRADGLWAYQLAVAVDDAAQGITEVVRGVDLLSSTPRQIYLQRLLRLSTPRYLHLPLAMDAAGQKLSKQSRAAPLPLERPVPLLCEALDLLGQQPPAGLREADLEGFWQWALNHWDPQTIPREGRVHTHPVA